MSSSMNTPVRIAEPIYLLSRTGLAPNNGTSVQLARILAGNEQSVVHLLWDTAEGGADSVPYSVVVEDPVDYEWPFRRGKGLYARVRHTLRLGWWAGDLINVQRLKRHLAPFPISPQLAYVICMREWDARKILALWRAVGRPDYVLHVMDLFHQELSESDTPRFVELIRRARHVACISALIEDQMKRSGARSTTIVPCCTSFAATARPPLQFPLRLVITGTIWNEYDNNSAMTIFVEAWEEIRRRFPGVQLHYAGNTGDRLPAALKKDVVNHGLISPEACEQLLRECHIAYLPVSHPHNTVGRFSVPSRIADYFACGLPVITCTEEGTGISSFMKTAPVTCSANVHDARTLVDAIAQFASNPELWAAASREAAEFATRRLSVAGVSNELFTLLNHTGKARVAEPVYS